MAAEVRYVGNHDIGNFLSQNGNPALGPLIAAGFSNVIPSNLHPCSDPTMPGFTDGYVDCTKTRVLLRSNRAYSIYHGLQSELRVANFHGVTATASYTFSKVIDNQSEVYSVGVGGGNTLAFAQDPFNVSGRPERAVSGYDFPHVVGISFIYDLPFFRTGSGFMGKILGGWQFNSTYRYTSGQPYTTIQSQGAGDQVLIGTSLCDPTQTMSTFYDACRPILASATAPLASVGICDPAVIGACSLLDYKAFVGGSSVPVSRNSVHWIVNDNVAAAAFGSPFLGVSRNTNRGQPISTANASMFKNTKLTERLTLQLRATAYNIMNVQFRGVPDPLLDDVLAGSFQNTYFNSNGGATFTGNCVYDGICQRRLEFGAKVIF
jgi:hypothetical protein